MELSVGIMSVVEDVGRHIDDEPDPTWEEAIAAFRAATPARVVRPPRQLTVVYRYADGGFTATSPNLTGFTVSGPSLHETQQLVQQDLARFLDPAVKVVERYPSPEPEIATAAGRSRFNISSVPGAVIVSTSSAGRAFVSSARAMLRRERVLCARRSSSRTLLRPTPEPARSTSLGLAGP